MLLHCPCLCCHSFCDSMWSFCVEANLFRSSCRLFIYVLLLEIQLSRGYGWDPINQFNHATCLCLSQIRTWIYNVNCCGFLCSLNRWEMIVRLLILVELLTITFKLSFHKFALVIPSLDFYIEGFFFEIIIGLIYTYLC